MATALKCLTYIVGLFRYLWWELTAKKVVVYNPHIPGGELCKIRNGFVRYQHEWYMLVADGTMMGGDRVVGLRWKSP